MSVDKKQVAFVSFYVATLLVLVLVWTDAGLLDLTPDHSVRPACASLCPK